MWQTGSDLKGKGPLNDILANVILLGQVEKLPENHSYCNATYFQNIFYTWSEINVSPVSNTLAYQKAGQSDQTRYFIPAL